ncbi:MAG: hypothetical protein GTN53_10675, partial [Candidatus Aminicenantes bacterium]|nr:hypothetical protein [Candidatus Aminicenantes bacterium]NIQ66916.1 hypothetical protein [Candidatus Aminicenantes bacterium]NIT22959.1 hypothetical protein [Candidatus Aminicenantes bacterium]
MNHRLSGFFIVCLVFTFLFSTCLFSKVQVGEEIIERIETPHPYTAEKGVVFERVFHYPNAGYIKIHFSKFDLAKGDYVEVSSPDGQFSYKYRENGKDVEDEFEPGRFKQISDFWATFIPGDTAIVRLHSKNYRSDFGFVIEKWARGYETGYIEAVLADLEDGLARTEAICSADNKEWAKCYDGTTMYNKSKAVCRLLIGGSSACTGWLLGSEGHVMTNNHCIGSSSEAQNTDYEFMAEGATCTTNCASWGACPGTVEASSGTLIKNDYNLDYSLIKLPTNVTGTYGYLQFRDTLAIVGERIYIPQHPGAYGKQLAVESDVDGPYAKVYNTNATPCHGGPGDIGYYADTAGGSSGSPVIGYDDHLVVALHHCANCPNRGVPIPSIISHLGADLPADAVGAPNPPADPTNLTANAVACDQVDLAWTDNADNESGFSIERSTDGTNFAEITTVGANVTSHSDTTAAEDTTYWYRVSAYNGAGNSGYTNTASDTTPVCPPPEPDPPTGLVAAAGEVFVDLDWADNTEPDLASYNVKRSTTTGGPYTQIANVTASAYTDNNVTAGTTYYYVVTAVDTDSYESGNSNEASATPFDNPPAAPTGLTATAGNGQVDLDWADNTESDLASYNVKRATTTGGPYTQVANVTVSSWNDTTVTNGTTYYYVVTAVDTGSNESGNSNEASATPTDNPPAAPTGLTATAGHGQVDLDWADNTEPDLASYNVKRSTTSGGPYTQIANVTASNYTDTTVTNGTT